ncbi:MAG: DUF2796 domain-containing protein [Hyphomicrobiaceae bacterium]
MKRSTRTIGAQSPKPLAGTAVAIVASATMLALPGLGHAAEEHRELGPHQHGHGKVNIAVEGTAVAIELEVPGMDIVGFEHVAQSDADKQALEAAKAKLADPLAVFGIPAAAKCTVEKVDVTFGQHHDDHDDHEKKDADAHAGREHHGDKAEAHGADAPGKEEDHEHGHSEVEAVYKLACAEPAALTSLNFGYFEMFAGAEELDVGVVTEKSQASFEVTRTRPKLALDGMM